MKKIFRVGMILAGVLVIAAIAAYLYLNEPLPNRSDQGRPELLRKRVNQRLNFAAYDTTLSRLEVSVGLGYAL